MSTTIFAVLCERRLRWLGHARRMDKSRIQKDKLFGQLEQESRKTGRPHLCYRDESKRDLKSGYIDIVSLENVAINVW